MSDLVVRAWNVGFGDAFLVSVPEAAPDGGEVTRHLLIDVGNLLAGDGNQDDVFAEVVAEVSALTGGTVDLYLLTHEHLDHAQGLLAAHRAGVPLAARHCWLTGSAHPDYYETHAEAKKRRLEERLALEDAVRVLQVDPDAWLAAMVRNNTAALPAGALGLSTADYVDHLRGIAPAEHTHYVDRTTELAGTHPFVEATLRVLAPEEDTSVYYGRPQPRPTLTAASAALPAEPLAGGSSGDVAGLPSVPPVGVDPGAFYDLQASRRRTTRNRVLEIDAANNNTSVVLELEWRGWRLLFPGDAEIRSWQTMRTLDLLRPAHFVKISHHGSHNGTHDELLDVVLPPTTHDGRARHALVSTHDGDWDSVPDEDATLPRYAARCTVHDTREVDRGEALELRFPG